jgi:hypothetical protein
VRRFVGCILEEILLFPVAHTGLRERIRVPAAVHRPILVDEGPFNRAVYEFQCGNNFAFSCFYTLDWIVFHRTSGKDPRAERYVDSFNALS